MARPQQSSLARATRPGASSLTKLVRQPDALPGEVDFTAKKVLDELLQVIDLNLRKRLTNGSESARGSPACASSGISVSNEVAMRVQLLSDSAGRVGSRATMTS